MVSTAQLNMKAGFTTMYTQASEFNGVLAAFNMQKQDELQNPIPDLHFTNGIQVGLRYKFDVIMIDFTWENTLRKRLGFGESADGSLLEKEYFFNFNAMSLSLETRLTPNFHFSAGIGRRTFRVRRDIGNSDRKINVFRSPAEQYYLQIKPIFVISPYARTPLAISPFFIYPLSDIGLLDFQNDLFDPTPDPITEVSERFVSFGLSLVYYYGGSVN